MPWYGNKWQNYGGGGGGWGSSQWQTATQRSNGQSSGMKYWSCGREGFVLSLREIGRGPWNNHPKAMQCGHCEQPWEKAQPKANEKLAAAKAMAMGMPAEAARVKPLANGGVSEEDEDAAMGSQGEWPKPRIAMTQEFDTIEDQLKLPRELNEDWTAEGCFGIFLPKQSTVEVTKLEEELADLKLLLGFQEKKLPGTTSSDAAATKKRTVVLQKLIEKAGDGTSKAALAACE